jgi:hypothetical protein
MGIVTYGTDVSKANTYRSQVIWEEANKRGLLMQQIRVFGKPVDLYRVQMHRKWYYFESLPVPPWMDQSSYAWMDDKYLLKREIGTRISVPVCVSVSTSDEAAAAFKKIGGVAVVKPRIGSRGRHTTTMIQSEPIVRSAFESARQLCHFAVVEAHLHGPVCRATVVGNTLAGFFAAHPPYVVGDGKQTIESLITSKNKQRPDRVEPIVLTDEHESFLRRQHLHRTSVPKKGERVELSQRTGRLFGGETTELLPLVHPKLRTYLEEATKALAAPIVGYDLIIEDATKDPDLQAWGIIEGNSLPFIDLHYLPLHGSPSPVAANVWDLWKY